MCTLVMLGDSYGPGAIVLGATFKKYNKNIETIVMITHDVSEKLRKKLEEIYDKVLLVNYTFCSTFMSSKRIANRYVGWINYSFTKWKCLLFEEYEKILFIDADLIVTDNVDEIFELNTPAGIFFNMSGKNKLNPNGMIHDNYYPNNVKTGSIITKKMIVEGYKNFDSSFVADASFMLLKPSKTKYYEMIKMFRKKNYYSYPTNVKSGPDEFILTELFGNWTNISILYNYRWKYDELKLKLENKKKGWNFGGIEKPWETPRDKYEDMKIWWNYADEIKDIDTFIVPKKYIDKSIVYFYDKNKQFDIDKDEWNNKGYVVTLISFEEILPHEIYDIFNVVCKMSKVDKIKSALLLTQFKEVYLFEYDMMLIHPDLEQYKRVINQK